MSGQVIDINKREIEEARWAVERQIFLLEENIAREKVLLGELRSMLPKRKRSAPRKKQTLKEYKKKVGLS